MQNKNIYKFVRDQLSCWPLACDNFRALKNVRLRDMDAGGVYEKRMRETMEEFFAVEPFKSLQNRFNVYMVKAVSKHEGNFDGDEHAIDTSDDKAFVYVDYIHQYPIIIL